MADIETPKPDEAAVETPLKVEATVETPLKVEATVETPIKDEATVETPIKVEAAVDKNGSASCPDIETKIIRQVEHYFGDYNLTRDKFLLEKIKEDDGWISMEVMLKFQRLIKISTDVKLILESLKKSDSGLLEVDEEKLRIRRSPSKPLPEVDDATAAQAKLSVYVKGFEKEKTTLDDLLQFFEKYENVVNVFMRTYPDKKTKEKNINRVQ
jgi:lupus La protein